jgi:hypothetical protein
VSELLLAASIVAVWLAALLMLAGLCAAAKAGDRTRINARGDAHGPSRRARGD